MECEKKEGRGDEYDDDDDGVDYGVAIVVAEATALGGTTPLVAVSARAKFDDAAVVALPLVHHVASTGFLCCSKALRKAQQPSNSPLFSHRFSTKDLSF